MQAKPSIKVEVPPVLDALALPARLHIVAMEQLNGIMSAATIPDVSRLYNRADGIVYGWSVADVITDDASGRLWVIYQDAHDNRKSEILAARR